MSGETAAERFDNGVGFSEIRIPSVPPQREMLRLPTDLLQMAGSGSLQHRLDIVLTRDLANPAEPFKSDPEAFMDRTFTLPTARSFSISGTARVSALAPDQDDRRHDQRIDQPCARYGHGPTAARRGDLIRAHGAPSNWRGLGGAKKPWGLCRDQPAKAPPATNCTVCRA